MITKNSVVKIQNFVVNHESRSSALNPDNRSETFEINQVPSEIAHVMRYHLQVYQQNQTTCKLDTLWERRTQFNVERM